MLIPVQIVLRSLVHSQSLGFDFPSAAEGFVEGDKVLAHDALAVHQLIFSAKERALGIEHAQEIAVAGAVKFGGDSHCAAIGDAESFNAW